MLRSIINDLQQFTIRATDGDIGRVDDFYFDDREWTIRYLVVDTGQWLPGRRVLISPRAIRRVDLDAGALELDLTKQKIHDSPDMDTSQPVSRQREAEWHSYYGYPNYWGWAGGPGSWAAWSHPPGATAPPLPADALRSEEPPAKTAASPLPADAAPEPPGARREPAGQDQSGGDPRLRSTREVSKYDIQATDGEIGSVKDFIADDETWAIRYLVVGTGGWIGGRNALLDRQWVDRVDWAGSKVHVSVSREEVKTSPEYDPSQLLNRTDEEALHRHYRRG